MHWFANTIVVRTTLKKGDKPKNAQPLPAHTKTQKNSSRSVLGKIGCGVGVAILLILLVLGSNRSEGSPCLHMLFSHHSLLYPVILSAAKDRGPDGTTPDPPLGSA